MLTAILLGTFAAPAVADCATAGLNVKCLYAGPDRSDADTSSATDGGPRFVTVTRTPGARITSSGGAGHRVFPPARSTSAKPHLQPGDVLPADVLILMNPPRYGLPRPRDGWTYFTVGDGIYRADIITRRVLNYVNPHITRR